ncbi:MAG TPA: hypothetical protein VHD56_04145 [Tepidisphaeraceae bacterium]|nr:hypothetical protein [Tepidisphaeraceae bacterium]
MDFIGCKAQRLNLEDMNHEDFQFFDSAWQLAVLSKGLIFLELATRDLGHRWIKRGVSTAAK